MSEMREAVKWPEVLGVFIVLGILGCVVLSAIDGWGVFNSTALPAWVQAVGSVVAIVGTWMGTLYQVEKAQEARKIAQEQQELAREDERISRAEESVSHELSINAVCQEHARDVEKLCMRVDGYLLQKVSLDPGKRSVALQHSIYEIESVMDTIRTYTSHSVPERTVLSMIRLLRVAREVRRQLDRYSEGNGIEIGDGEKFITLIQAARWVKGDLKKDRERIHAFCLAHGCESRMNRQNIADMSLEEEDLVGGHFSA